LRLIERNLFDKITLRQITAEAGVSYPTFFNHYDDKDDLFQDIARKEILEFLTKGFRSGITSPAWRPGEGICAYVAARRALWRTLLTTGASEAMRSEFIGRARDLPQNDTGWSYRFPIDLVSGVIASGTFEIIAWWLGKDENYPMGAVADMLETLVIEPALNLPPGYLTNRT
jgi:AcrR family transcriptional regulator